MNFEPLSDSLIAQHERAQRQATLDGVATLLRAKGASERSLHTVLTGFGEYLTITSASPPPPSLYVPPSARPNEEPLSDLVTHDCTLPLSQIPTRPLTWLWPQRIPQGKLTLLDGEPGCGTSLLALTLAACLSSGLPLPGDTAAPTTQGNVLLIAPHDHAGDTIKPRLQAAGGDPNHIFLLSSVPTGAATPTAITPERPFCLADDLNLLEATIKRLHITLVIIDPLHSVLESARAHSSSTSSASSRRQTPPRSLLSALARLAQRSGCAILLVRSVIPTRSDLLRTRPSGSPELLSAIPSGLLITCDPGDESTHLLLPTKHTLCQKPATLAYEIIEHPSGVPVIHWRGTWQGSLAFVLGMSPALSAQRQTILAFLHQSQAPASAGEIISRTGFDYECVRKMLQRMAQQGDLMSPARGLYTTPHHPCLATISPDPQTNPPQNPVPSVAIDTLSPQTDVSPAVTETTPPQNPVPIVATENPPRQTDVSIVATETTFPRIDVPIVATENPSRQTDVSIVANVPTPQYSPLPVAPVSIFPSTTPDQTENAPP
jgi:hypothetical protein